MANTLKFGNGQWASKEGSVLAYNDENNNFKPLPFDFTRASGATRVNKDGLIEVVGNNEPRIDFSNDANGALLLEPQRTNYFFNSEGSALTLSTPYGSFGFYNLNDGNIAQAISYVGQISVSFVVKKLDGTLPTISKSSGSGDIVVYVNGASTAGLLGSFTEIGNGYYKYILKDYTSNGASTFIISNKSTITTYVSLIQYEEGSYATSYIPTSGAAVTRVADVCSQTVSSNIITQSEGTLYWSGDLNNLANYSNLISLSGGSGSWIYLLSYSAGLSFEIKSNFSTSLSFNPSGYTEGSYKVAISYNGSEAVIYINGILVHTDSSVVIPSFSTLNIGQWSGYAEAKNTKEIKLYNTRLSNAELIALTS